MKVKALIVSGNMINVGTQRVSTLSTEIEKAINEFCDSISGDVKDIQTETDFGSTASGGRALILVKYDGDVKKSEPVSVSKKKDK